MIGYKSPIDVIISEINTQFDGEVLKAVQKCDINVDKDELIKALHYDRCQYLEGYNAGYDARDKEIVRCIDCKWHTMIDEMLLCKADNAPHTYDWFCAQGEREAEHE